MPPPPRHSHLPIFGLFFVDMITRAHNRLGLGLIGRAVNRSAGTSRAKVPLSNSGGSGSVRSISATADTVEPGVAVDVRLTASLQRLTPVDCILTA